MAACRDLGPEQHRIRAAVETSYAAKVQGPVARTLILQMSYDRAQMHINTPAASQSLSRGSDSARPHAGNRRLVPSKGRRSTATFAISCVEVFRCPCFVAKKCILLRYVPRRNILPARPLQSFLTLSCSTAFSPPSWNARWNACAFTLCIHIPCGPFSTEFHNAESPPLPALLSMLSHGGEPDK